MSAEEKDEVFASGLGPLSPEDLNIKERLRKPACDPFRVLQQSIATGTASVQIVRLCLDTQFQELKRIPWRERRELALAQENIASMALDYLLGQNEHTWGAFAMYCTEAHFQLSYYAIVRGMEERIVQWMYLEVSEYATQGVWRGSLLRALIRAHSYLAIDPKDDASVRCFLDALARRQVDQAKFKEELARNEHAPKPQALYLNLLPTIVYLSTCLTSDYSHDTDSKLCDQFIMALQMPDTYNQPRPQCEMDYDVAYLLLYYPRYPKDTSAMTLLRRFAAGDADAFPSRIMTPRGQLYFKRFLQRTIDVLQVNDNATDREWVKHTYNSLVDPATGNFAPPTRIVMSEKHGEDPGRGNRAGRASTEPVPFPTFT